MKFVISDLQSPEDTQLYKTFQTWTQQMLQRAEKSQRRAEERILQPHI